MKIFDHFQHITLTADQHNALEKLYAFLESDDQVFILLGYAGSGKTTLLKGLIDYLLALKKPIDVMAPTGRAAKILRDKTGYGQTIHRTIYNFEVLKTLQGTENEDDHSFHYVFPISKIDNNGKILIVDESSMISSVESQIELFTFGTNILLNDLLTYCGIPDSTNKIIFVGDPAQLPPVGDNLSNALMPEYFETLDIKTDCCILKEVVRQQDNLILKNATKIRTLLDLEIRNELSIAYDETCFIKTKSEDIANQYSEKFPVPELGQGVIIAFSNSQCLHYNNAVRKKIFPLNETVTSGDILIFNHNNYHTYGVELMNGEMAKVMSVDHNLITRKNIPVYEAINGKHVKKYISLTFRSVTLRVLHHPNEINCMVIDSLLNSPNRDLTISEMKALYVDFVMRFKDEQKAKKEKGLPVYLLGSEEFKQQLKTDTFFNALRVKYGYSITCHKAQGGEWSTTFVDYYGRTSLKNDPLRWSYTATTRAIERCYAANAPHVTLFSQFQINEIQTLTNIPVNALFLENVPVSPFHSDYHHRAKSLKFWELAETLETSPFQIISVNSFGDFQERYTIAFEGQQSQFDAHHNHAGLFNDFHALHPKEQPWHDEVLKLLNQPAHFPYNVNYTPSQPVLEKLYGLIQSLCNEEAIIVTNIEEKIENYYVNYFLKTDSKCACIQFYFNGKGELTRALPKSTSGRKDEKVLNLISNLRDHVI